LQAGKGGDGGAPVRVVAWLDLQGQQSKLKSQTNQEIKIIIIIIIIKTNKIIN
jgi:hypothetical protein